MFYKSFESDKPDLIYFDGKSFEITETDLGDGKFNYRVDLVFDKPGIYFKKPNFELEEDVMLDDIDLKVEEGDVVLIVPKKYKKNLGVFESVDKLEEIPEYWMTELTDRMAELLENEENYETEIDLFVNFESFTSQGKTYVEINNMVNTHQKIYEGLSPEKQKEDFLELSKSGVDFSKESNYEKGNIITKNLKMELIKQYSDFFSVSVDDEDLIVFVIDLALKIIDFYSMKDYTPLMNASVVEKLFKKIMDVQEINLMLEASNMLFNEEDLSSIYRFDSSSKDVNAELFDKTKRRELTLENLNSFLIKMMYEEWLDSDPKINSPSCSDIIKDSLTYIDEESSLLEEVDDSKWEEFTDQLVKDLNDIISPSLYELEYYLMKSKDKLNQFFIEYADSTFKNEDLVSTLVDEKLQGFDGKKVSEFLKLYSVAEFDEDDPMAVIVFEEQDDEEDEEYERILI